LFVRPTFGVERALDAGELMAGATMVARVFTDGRGRVLIGGGVTGPAVRPAEPSGRHDDLDEIDDHDEIDGLDDGSAGEDFGDRGLEDLASEANPTMEACRMRHPSMTLAGVRVEHFATLCTELAGRR
jgi:hypothetical protein